MQLKDHYQVLEIPVSATTAEIKSAYRRLALQFHPDKNNNDPYANARFAEVKEAYEVLINPTRKEIYLQQRWYAQSMGIKRKQGSATPVDILKQVIELEKHVSKLDVFRLDKLGLHDHIASLIDDATISKLNEFKDPVINGQITQRLIECLKILPLDLVRPLHTRLQKLDTDENTKQKMKVFLLNREKMNRRDRLRIWIILLTVVVLCLLIFLLAE